jgi:hypothetical protein
MEPNAANETLILALAAQIPPEPIRRVSCDVFDRPLDEPDGPIHAELRRLLEGLQADPMIEWIVTTAIGRLRHLYPQGNNANAFSKPLLAVLRQIVAAYPALRHCPQYVRPSPSLYMRVGGEDVRAKHGYEPQHRSRILHLFH